MKRTRENLLTPPPKTLILFVNHIHLEWEEEEVAAAASSEEHKGGKLIGRSVWEKALNIMLIAHPPQFAFHANYRKAKCEISFSPLLSVRCTICSCCRGLKTVKTKPFIRSFKFLKRQNYINGTRKCPKSWDCKLCKVRSGQNRNHRQENSSAWMQQKQG